MGAVRALHGAHWLSALGIRVLPARVLHVPTGRGGLSALGIRASASAHVLHVPTEAGRLSLGIPASVP